MRTLSSVPDPAARFGARDHASPAEALRPARPAARDDRNPSRLGRGKGLDGWTILLIAAIVAGLVGMLVGGVLSV